MKGSRPSRHSLRMRPFRFAVILIAACLWADETSDRLFLVLYGTGVRGADVSVRMGSADVPVLYAGPQGQYPGLDQINTAELPRSLAGAGQVNVILKCDGVAANMVAIAFQ